MGVMGGGVMSGVKFPPCVDSGLWMPFSQHRGGREGERVWGRGGAAEKSSIASTGIRGQRDRRFLPVGKAKLNFRNPGDWCDYPALEESTGLPYLVS